MQRKNSPNVQRTTRSKKTPRRAAKQTASLRNSPMGYAPVAMSRAVQPGRNPGISTSGGVTRITHTEFFASVTSSSTDFAVTGFPLNPGVASIFPWLSQVAQRYETYKFRRLCFEYHTRAASTQVGTVGIVFDFDAQDGAPASQMEALSYHDKSADSPWKDQMLVLDLVQGDRLPIRYTRSGLPPTPYDIKTLDLGNLFVFVDGVASSANLGLLEVSYTVDLFTPQIQDGIGGTLTGLSLDATHLIGAVVTPDIHALFPFSVSSSSTLTFNQAFEGICAYHVVGTSLVNNFNPVVSGASSVAAVVTAQVNGAGTTVDGWFKIRAGPGTTFTPTMSASTVGNVRYDWARANYDQIS